MKIAIYHPNLHFMGGGETVCLTIASELQSKHDVTIFSTKKTNRKQMELFFDLNLKKIQFKTFGKLITQMPFLNSFKQSLYLKSLMPKLDKFDVVIDTCSNGLFYKQLKSKTICYVHFPNYTKRKKGIKSLLNFLLIKEQKMFTYDKILCNSKFTTKQVQKLTDNKIEVLYPPVQIEKIKQKKKKNVICSIGRFSPEKKFEPLIDAFIRGQFKDFELHLIGAYREEADKEYYAKLKQLAKGHKIIFHKNINHDKVLRFLETTKIYWHARGFGEIDPVEYENFGITTVEAMAAGCIPIVIKLGAQPEIIKDGVNGYTWETIEELIEKTKNVIKTKSSKMKNTANKYSVMSFLDGIKKELK